MSREIDERVVSMKFDNKDFEKGVAQTMDTLDALDKKLDFKGAAKGFEEIDKAANKVTLSGLSKSVEAVQVKFSTMSIIAMSALDNIVDRAMSAGEQLVKSLTITPISAGFSKYEQNLTSVQAIMNATGRSIEDVESQMNRLMLYTDETSYSFSDMVANVGKFTSQRIPLETAVSAMMGIANAAGFAGANVENASHAMQGFSKAMAKGYMDRQSWQWIQTAQMAIPELKEQFMEYAVEIGTLKKTQDGLYLTTKKNVVSVEQFEEAMKDGWLTTEVMNKALGAFGSYSEEVMKRMEATGKDAATVMKELDAELDKSGNQAMILAGKMFKASQESRTFSDAINSVKDAVSTGWMRTFKILFGNLEEAKSLWSEVGSILYDIFAEPGNARNEMLERWAKSHFGGREMAIHALIDAIKNLIEIVNTFKEGFAELFPPVTVETLINMVVKFKEFANSLKLSEESLYSLKVIAKAVATPLYVVFQAVKVGATLVGTLVKVVFTLVDSFLYLSAIGNPFAMLMEKIFGEERFNRISSAISTITSKIGGMFSSVGKKISDAFGGRGILEVVISFIQKMGEVLAPIGEIVLNAIVWGFEALASLDFTNIKEFILSFWGFLKDVAGGIMSGFTSGLSMAAESLSKIGSFSFRNWANNFKKDVKSVATEVTGLEKAFSTEGIVKTINEGASSIVGKLANVGSAVGDLVSKISPASIIVSGLGLTFIELSHNIALAIGSFANIAKSFDKLIGSFTGITNSVKGVIDTFGKSLKAKVQVQQWKTITLCIIGLAAALAALSFVPQDKLRECIFNIGILMGEMAGFYTVITLLSKLTSGKLGEKAGAEIKKFGATVALLGGAILLLAGAMKIISSVDTTNMFNQMGYLIALLAALTTSMLILSKHSGDAVVGAGSIVALAVAIKILAKAMVQIGKVEFNNVLETFATLLAIVGVMKLITKSAKGLTFQSASGMLVMSLAILSVVSVLKKVAAVDVETLLTGLGKYLLLFGVMASLAVVARIATNKLEGGKSLVAVSGMFLSMALAVNVLSMAIRSLGGMNTGELIKGTIAIEAILAMFALILKVSKTNILESGEQAKQNFLGMAAAILAMTLSIDYLGGMDTAKLVKGTAAVAVLLALFAVVEFVGKKSEAAKGSAVFIAGAIAAITVSLMLLTLVPFEKAIGAAASLGLVLAAVGEALKNVDKITGKGTTAAVIKMGVIIAGLTTALLLMAGQDWKNLLTSAASLSLVMVAMADVAKVLNGVKFELTLKQLVTLGLVVAGIGVIGAAIVTALDKFVDADGIVGKAAAFSLVVLALAGVAAILGNLKIDNMKSIGRAAVAVIGTVVLVGAIAAAFGELSETDSWKKWSSNANTILVDIAKVLPFVALAGLVGAVIATACKNISLKGIGLGVVAILGVVASMAIIVTALGALMELDWFKKFIASGGEALVSIFNTFGEAIGAIIGGIGKGIVTGLDLPYIAEQIAAFTNTLATADPTGVTNFATIAESFWKLFENIPTRGGLKNVWEGHADFEALFSNLTTFADGIKDMTSKIGDGSDINLDGIKKATDAAGYVADLENKLPKTGGLVQAWFGQGNLSTFSGNLTKFGEAISGYANAVDGFDDNKKGFVQKSADAGKFLSDLENSLPKQGGIIADWFFGEKSLAMFGQNLTSFGTALLTFSSEESAGGITNWDVFGQAVTAVEGLRDIANTLPEVGPLNNLFGGTISLSDFGMQLSALGGWFSQYYESIKGVGWAVVGLATDKLSEFLDMAAKLPNFDSKTAQDFGKAMLILASTGFDEFAGVFKSDSANTRLAESATVMGNTVLTTLSNVCDSKKFDDIGKNVVLGLRNGMTDNASILKTAAIHISDDMVGAFEKNLEIASPSKRFIRVSKFCVLGLERGFVENAPIANKAASNVAEHMLEAMKETLGIHSPSYRVRQEVAGPVLDAFPAEFDENNTAEKAAKAKGEAIAQAFKEGFTENADLREIMDLERQLFELKLDPNLTDVEKQNQLLEFDKEQKKKYLETYVNDYKLSVQQYQTMVKQYGEESSFAQEAKRQLLQQEINLRKYSNEMAEELNQQIQNGRESAKENYQKLLELMDSQYADRIMQNELRKRIESGDFVTNRALDEMTRSILESEGKLGKAGTEWKNTTPEDVISAQLRAFDVYVKQGTWEEQYKDVMRPIVDYTWNFLADQFGYKTTTSNEELVDGDALVKNLLGGFTIDEYAMQDVAAEMTDAFNSAVIDSISESAKAAGAKASDSLYDGFKNGPGTNPDDSGIEKIKKEIEKGIGEGVEGAAKELNFSGIMSGLDDMLNGIQEKLSGTGDWLTGAISTAGDWISGLVGGVRDGAPEVGAAGEYTAEELQRMANNTLGIHSPSTVAYQSGMYWVQGWVNALFDGVGLVANAAGKITSAIANSAPEVNVGNMVDINSTTGLATEIADSIGPIEPVVTPVLDLSKVEAGVQRLSAMISSTQAAVIASSMPTAPTVNQNGSEPKTGSAPQITFNQYNTSPKALNQIEIYRRTNNQLSSLKEALKHK